MKAKNILRTTAVLIAIIGFSVTGCKKDKDNTDTSSMQQLSKDEVLVQASTDDVLNDANNILSGGSSSISRTESRLFPCNATIDSVTHSTADTVEYYITFNGENCSGTLSRYGNVIVKKAVGTHWINAGATVSVTYIGLRITKNRSGKTLTLTGTKMFENVSGGLIFQLGSGVTSVTHRITGAVEATFDDGTVRTWNITRQRVFTGTSGQLVCTESGFGSADGYDNLVVWGVDRKGENFYTQLTTPVVFEETCGWDPVSGVKVHQIPGDTKSATITFGYNSSDVLVTGSDCPTQYRLDWVKGKHSGTIYLPLM